MREFARREFVWNRVLGRSARMDVVLQSAIDSLRIWAGDVMNRKPEGSWIQQAWMYEAVWGSIRDATKDRLLCVGAYEDPVGEAFRARGSYVDLIDPVLNITLEEHLTPERLGSYDIVFATSVIEHVEDDIHFLDNMIRATKPGGSILLTTDLKEPWNPGDPTPSTNRRFYTPQSLSKLATEAILKTAPTTAVALLPTKECWAKAEEEQDFWWEGIRYCFASLALLAPSSK